MQSNLQAVGKTVCNLCRGQSMCVHVYSGSIQCDVSTLHAVNNAI